jgi:glycosyltransferase involved in cell wall biosynthesis
LSSIIEEFPNAKFYIFSSNNEKLELNKLIKNKNLDNNIVFPALNNISSYLKKSSIFLYTSLEEEFPYILNEAISYGVSCIIFSNILNSLPFKNELVTINISEKIEILKEITKLFNDKNYRKKNVEESKLSLEKFNKDVANLWEQLFVSLKDE